MYDLVIKGAQIIDGSGQNAYRADVAVLGERIVKIGSVTEEAAEVINGTGKYVTPGFIHMHSHGDCSAAIWPQMESSVGQGITTEFTGHCGLGVAPVPRYWVHMFAEKLAFEKVLPPPVGGASPYGFRMVETDLLRPVFEETYGERLDWSSFGEWKDHLNRRGLGANIAPLVGHAQIRAQVMGLDYERAATAKERTAMQELLMEALEHGALGLGIGLDYLPGLWADREELLCLMRTVAAYGGLVTAHIRMLPQKHYKEKQTIRAGMEEFLQLALTAGARAHISHITAVGEDVNGQPVSGAEAAKETLDIVEKYRRMGLTVSWDVIPRYCYGPFHYAMLASLFEPYVQACGGLREFADCLKRGSYAREVEREIAAGQHASRGVFTKINPVANPNWDAGQRFTKSRVPGIEGKTIREAAEAAGVDSLRFCLQVLAQDPETYVVPLGRRPEETADRDAFAARPEATIALDCWTMDYDGRLSYDNMPLECGSPDTYCGMFLYLEQQKARGERMETILRRLTGGPADILGFRERGYVREGYYADLLLLDWENLASREQLWDPRQSPAGLSLVCVNGQIALRDGVQTHVRSGRCVEGRKYDQ